MRRHRPEQPRLLFVMDPIERIHVAKDSTFAMLLEVQRRGWPAWACGLEGLYLTDGVPRAQVRSLRVFDDPTHWFEAGEMEDLALAEFDVIFMRKDPPFDSEYLYATLLLDLAQVQGALVVNDPQALRDCNEKLCTAWFPQCCVPTLVTRDVGRLLSFVRSQGAVVVKPLDTMGGESVFRIQDGDPNTNVILETVTRHGTRTIMAQRFIPEVSQGDKRILLIEGRPVPYALARIPRAGEARANLAVGGEGRGVALSERDRWICAQVGPELRRRGLVFVGLDVIGDWLTEINVTSPTCIRELDRIYHLNIASQIMDAVIQRLRARAQGGDP